jgi:hypothetical protein
MRPFDFLVLALDYASEFAGFELLVVFDPLLMGQASVYVFVDVGHDIFLHCISP